MCSSFPGLLIGQTAVHSGKDRAFVAYDQFLSTGILQPLSSGEVRCGPKCKVLARSTCFPVYPQHQTFDGPVGTAVSCQEATYAMQQKNSSIRSPRRRGRAASAGTLPLRALTAPA